MKYIENSLAVFFLHSLNFELVCIDCRKSLQHVFLNSSFIILLLHRGNKTDNNKQTNSKSGQSYKKSITQFAVYKKEAPNCVWILRHSGSGRKDVGREKRRKKERARRDSREEEAVGQVWRRLVGRRSESECAYAYHDSSSNTRMWSTPRGWSRRRSASRSSYFFFFFFVSPPTLCVLFLQNYNSLLFFWCVFWPSNLLPALQTDDCSSRYTKLAARRSASITSSWSPSCFQSCDSLQLFAKFHFTPSLSSRLAYSYLICPLCKRDHPWTQSCSMQSLHALGETKLFPACSCLPASFYYLKKFRKISAISVPELITQS